MRLCSKRKKQQWSPPTDRAQGLQVFEVALEHPEGFLVDLDATDGEVLSFEVVGVFGGVADGLGAGDGLFMALDEVSDEVFGGGVGDAELVDFGQFGQGGEAAGGEDVQGAEAFGYFVDGGEEFLVLGLEGGVELEEGGAFDVPVREVGLGHQRIAVGEQRVEGGGDGGDAGGGGFGGRAHGFGLFGIIPNWDPFSPLQGGVPPITSQTFPQWCEPGGGSIHADGQDTVRLVEEGYREAL